MFLRTVGVHESVSEAVRAALADICKFVPIPALVRVVCHVSDFVGPWLEDVGAQ